MERVWDGLLFDTMTNVTQRSVHHIHCLYNYPMVESDTISVCGDQIRNASHETLMAYNVDSLSALLIAGIGVASFYLSYINAEPQVHPSTLVRQSQITTSRMPGETAIYRNRTEPHGRTLDSFIKYKTVYQLFWEAVEKHQELVFLGSFNGKGYTMHTYQQLGQKVLNFGRGLLRSNNFQDQKTVGIMIDNSTQWMIVDYSCASFGLVSCPLVPDVDLAIEHINQAQLVTVVVTQKHALALIDHKNPLTKLKSLIITDLVSIDQPFKDRAKRKNLTLLVFADLERIGMNLQTEPTIPKPEDPYTILFSDKMITLTHQNMAASSNAMVYSLPPAYQWTSDDLYLTFFSLCNIHERQLVHSLCIKGARVYFSRSGFEEYLQDLVIVKPTILMGQERLLHALHIKITKEAKKLGLVGKGVYDMAQHLKKQLLENGLLSNKTVWDKVVFSHLHDLVGGKVRLMILLGKPRYLEMETLRIILGIPVLRAFGYQETSGTCLLTTFGDDFPMFPQSIGPPISGVEIRLKDNNDLEFRATDQPNPRGIFCIRGPSVVVEDWLTTNDIAEIYPNGTFRIIDSMDRFRMSNQRMISFNEIEELLQTDECQSRISGETLVCDVSQNYFEEWLID